MELDKLSLANQYIRDAAQHAAGADRLSVQAGWGRCTRPTIRASSATSRLKSARRNSASASNEARAIASLNHPKICQLYDAGQNFLVMELVEGETLSGPLPVETALNYSRQIAEALEAAHEKGIVHRDLKPANVRITPAGVVKVLDFGLATTPEEPVGADSSNSPTLTISPTRAGMILGTAAYMSPEQARGAVVDKRADIWASGSSDAAFPANWFAIALRALCCHRDSLH
jgi:serine/threonine protein kinase